MAKANITEYDSTAGNNTVINDIDISEGCSPSTINNAIRELMAHLKNVDTGSQALTALSVTGNVSVGGTFTSRGIDDNADALAMTIDNSEHVLVGTTDQDDLSGGAGIRLKSYGRVGGTVDGGISGLFNRLSNHGGIVGFYKDGTGVGQIDSSSGNLLIRTSGNTGGIRFDTNSLTPFKNGSQTDNAVDLGFSNARFKDLYLSGNVYLGGTGSANELDDYEEGTWTPQVYSNVTQIATSSVYGFYTKVGDLIHINGQVSRNDSASLSSAFLLKNLPFTSKSGTGCVYVNGGFWFDKASATDEVGFGYMSGGSTTVYVKTLNLSAAYITADALENSRPVYFAFTYKTAT